MVLPFPCISRSHWVHEWAEAFPTTVTGRITKQNDQKPLLYMYKLRVKPYQLTDKMFPLHYTSILTQMSRFLLWISVLIFSTTVLRLDLMLSDISSEWIRNTIMSGHVQYYTFSLYLMLCASCMHLLQPLTMYCSCNVYTSIGYDELHSRLALICYLLSSFLVALLLPGEEGNTLSTSGEGGGKGA